MGRTAGRPDRRLVAVIPGDPVARPVLRLDDLEDLALAGRLTGLVGIDDDAIALLDCHGAASVDVVRSAGLLRTRTLGLSAHGSASHQCQWSGSDEAPRQ